MNNTTYDRRSIESIFEYLKEQAGVLSNGRWTDFSAGDIGSVMLGLMAFLADQNNFQIDKTASELFLDTAIERSSLMALLKLVGYEPRHYESAKTTIELNTLLEEVNNDIIPAYTQFTNIDGTLSYYNLLPIIISNSHGTCEEVYEGTRVSATYQYSNITADGKLYLPDYRIGVNTVQLYIPSLSSSLIERVKNVKFTAGEFVFSVHVDEEARVYIQLPSFWTDVLTESSTLRVSYLLTNGEAGRIGKNIITKFATNNTLASRYSVTNPEQSTGGYFPETVDEIKISAPIHARTMDTIVTKKDLNELTMADDAGSMSMIKCGDYNDDWTGYVQPDDAYKCKVLAVPHNYKEISIYYYTNDNDPSDTNIYWYDEYNQKIYDENMNEVTGIYINQLTRHLTDKAKEMIAYIDENRLASLMFTYEDAKRFVPNIRLNIYTDPTDIRTLTIANQVENFMKEFYYRDNLEIGQSLPGSVIGKDILNNFDVITYIEVVEPDINIEVDEDMYIDMYYAKFNIYVNDELIVNEYDIEQS